MRSGVEVKAALHPGQSGVKAALRPGRSGVEAALRPGRSGVEVKAALQVGSARARAVKSLFGTLLSLARDSCEPHFLPGTAVISGCLCLSVFVSFYRC